MQNSNFVSGFLYSLKTNKILLIQTKKPADLPSLWSTIGQEVKNSADTKSAFGKIANKLLGVTLKPKDIYPVYDYFHETLGQTNYVFYAEVKNPKILTKSKNLTFSWFAFSEIAKLKFPPGTKQDVIVGERVINAKWREQEAKNSYDLQAELEAEGAFAG